MTERGRAILAADKGVPASRIPSLSDLALPGVDATGDEPVEELSLVRVRDGVRDRAGALRSPTLRYLSNGDGYSS